MDQMECYPTILARGQVTIPQEVRDTLGLNKGDTVKLTVETIE